MGTRERWYLRTRGGGRLPVGGLRFFSIPKALNDPPSVFALLQLMSEERPGTAGKHRVSRTAFCPYKFAGRNGAPRVVWVVRTRADISNFC